MEHHETSKLLKVSFFEKKNVLKKMIYWIVNIKSAKIQGLKIPMLRSDFCDYSDTFIVVKEK